MPELWIMGDLGTCQKKVVVLEEPQISTTVFSATLGPEEERTVMCAQQTCL